MQQFLDFTGQTQILSDAFEIYNNSGSNTTATVAVSDTALTLVGSGTGTDAFTFSSASYDTMAELVAAITALAEGWQVILLSGTGVNTTNLVPFAATDVYGQAQAIRLQYANTSIIEDWINGTSQAIETYLGTSVVARTDIREWLDGRGDEDLILKNRPVTGVKRIAYGASSAFTVQCTRDTDLRATVEVQDAQLVLSRVASSGTETASTLSFATYPTATQLVSAINLLNSWSATDVTNCLSLDLHRRAGMDALLTNVDITFPDTSAAVQHVDEGAGIVHLVNMGYNQFGRYSYLAEYAAGYALASVPADIVTAAWKLAQALQQGQARDGSLQSESLGQYSYSNAVNAQQALTLISGEIASLLHYHRNYGA